jgi:hypothetical protein
MALNTDTLATPNTSTYGSMEKGQWLTSENGYYILKLTSDGDLVGYHRFKGDVFWEASTAETKKNGWFFNAGATKVSQQTDGNLVTYDGGTATWATSLLAALTRVFCSAVFFL